MAKRKILLVEAPPKFDEHGGLFYVDFDIAGVPILALKPSGMLKSIAKARIRYEQWAAEQVGKAI